MKIKILILILCVIISGCTYNGYGGHRGRGFSYDNWGFPGRHPWGNFNDFHRGDFHRGDFHGGHRGRR